MNREDGPMTTTGHADAVRSEALSAEAEREQPAG